MKGCPRCSVQDRYGSCICNQRGSIFVDVVTDVEFEDLDLAVQGAPDPEPLFFRGPSANILADICGECGHVELKLRDPAAFCRAHFETLEKKREAVR